MGKSWNNRFRIWWRCFFLTILKNWFSVSRPTTAEEIRVTRSLGNLVTMSMEIYTMNIDGSDLKQITHLGKANWSPISSIGSIHQAPIQSSFNKRIRFRLFHWYWWKKSSSNYREIEFNAFPCFRRRQKIRFLEQPGDTPHETNVS